MSSKNTKSNKRKRPKPASPSTQYANECLERYNKLHHISSKLLYKEGKVVKSFECKKIVRSIKTANESLKESNNQDETNKLKTKVATLEQKLERTKKLDLDVLVSIGMKRLGVLSLDPKLHSDHVKNEEQIHNVKDQTPQDQGKFYTSLIETMLSHKRLSTVMDQINEKVSDYRHWVTHQKELLSRDDGTDHKSKKKKKKQAQDRNDTLIVAGSQKRRKIDLGGHEGTSGLFIGSLSGQKVEGYSDDDEYDNYDDINEVLETKKKNRPGQRARKAKAMALEAKKAGRTWDSSINWREKKSEIEQNDTRDQRNIYYGEGSGSTKRGRQKQNNRGIKATPAKMQDIATMGKSWKEEGKSHPSWAAAAAQKSQGIAEFKGTKITF